MSENGRERDDDTVQAVDDEGADEPASFELTADNVWVLVEDALARGAGALAERARGKPHWFSAAVVDRSRRYTSERGALHRPADAQADLAARALFFSVVDAAKPLAPLLELVRRGGLPVARGSSGAAPTLRVLDLGAGCGAMSLGLLATAALHGWRARWELTLVDRDAEALAIAVGALTALAETLGAEIAVQRKVVDLASWRPEPGPPRSLALLGTVLNELAPAAGRALVMGALAQVAPAGAVLVLEPALRESARALQALRDELVAAGDAAVLGPCTHAHTPCPALARDTDWCHEDRPWRAPPYVRAVADATRLRDGNLKYAYLLLAPPGAPVSHRPLGPAAPAHELVRVVSGALPGKGKKELFACGAAGRVLLRRLDRRASPATAWFDELRRGDLVAVPSPRLAEAGPGGRVDLAGDEDWATVPVATDPLEAAAAPASGEGDAGG